MTDFFAENGTNISENGDGANEGGNDRFRSINYTKVLNTSICEYTMLVIMKLVLIVVILLKIENVQRTPCKPHRPPSACGCEAITMGADDFSINGLASRQLVDTIDNMNERLSTNYLF